MIPLWQRMMLAGQWTTDASLAPDKALILRQLPVQSDTGIFHQSSSQMAAAQMAAAQMAAAPAKARPAQDMEKASRRQPLGRAPKDIAPPAPISVELRSLSSCRLLLGEWRELQSRCLEANAFAAPEIMMSAAQHLPAAQPPVALVLRNNQQLLGIIALESARLPILPGALHSYVTPYHPVGVPLIDRRHAATVINRTLQWCADQAEPLGSISGDTLGLAGIIWHKLPLDGAFAALLRQIASQSGRDLQVLDAYERPILMAGAVSGTGDAVSSVRLRHKLRRLRRRLDAAGTVRFVEATARAHVNQALETLMVLEAAGWKGKRGTAMAQNARISCFMRSAMRQMAERGQVIIFTMLSGETPVAAALILETQGTCFCFKIAHDPAFAKYSPGMILAEEVGLRLSARPGFHYADSCVDQEHSFMNRVWAEKASFGDVMIALQARATPAASAMHLRERLRRRIRSEMKSLYHRLRRD
jgi:Acetyltransferase (GNAT) domain